MRPFKASKRPGGFTRPATKEKLATTSQSEPSTSRRRIKKAFASLTSRLHFRSRSRTRNARHHFGHHGDRGDQRHPESHPESQRGPGAFLKRQLTPRFTLNGIDFSITSRKDSARKQGLNKPQITLTVRCALPGEPAGQGPQGYSEGGGGGQGSNHESPYNPTRLMGARPNLAKGRGRKRKPPGDEPPNRDGFKKPKFGKPYKKPRVACPFYKHDRKAHPKCRNAELRTVADVRRHIMRAPAHRQPTHCPICKCIFEGRDDAELRHRLHEHIRQQENPCVERHVIVPGVTEDQKKKLEDSRNRAGSLTENWYEVWEILFPTVPRPNSPYHTGTEVQEMFDELMEKFRESELGQQVAAKNPAHTELHLRGKAQ
ncbi:hypothetical protein G7Z17_g4683 [Cylindrodendrum hubeiense]|uniref:C2H2-type domain-containing protein n=1 Tax=Cylindrodendrum hubeiense TaxID=595255 RepID=A0A9P5LGY0_9HYPO|nr:hypothetical protein G7Z17_g4683 [Cylindrodendrum hubeiense]